MIKICLVKPNSNKYKIKKIYLYIYIDKYIKFIEI